jgi:ribosomal-protein-alanine N-acetyltransferase
MLHRGSAGPPRPQYVRQPQAVERAAQKRPFEQELDLEPFTEKDLDEALPIEQSLFTDPWPRQFFLEELRVPQSLACVARHRGRMAGYLLAWRLEGEIHLGNLAVSKEYQRRGVGQALLSWLLDRTKEEGPGRITLEVRASNFAAQELYRRFGFQAVALRRGYYQDSGEDALVMMREL